ncbi:NACHT, LRR and PYD domains-containing protein 12-like, partial [Clarias magur]
SEDYIELLLARLMMLFSVWIWKKRSFIYTINSRTVTDTARDQSPASAPAVLTLVLNAENGSVVNVPAIINSTVSDHINFDITASTACTQALPQETKNKYLNLSTEVLHTFLASHKANMKKEFECVFEYDTKTKILLKKVYTQLYITEGQLKDVNKEHEILKIDKYFRVKQTEGKPINCNEIFSVSEENEEIKVLLTKGIAGIGKTVSVQKFILDWAEGEANQAIDCIFLLPFREINLIKDEEFSLHELLQEFYPELEKLSETDLYEELKLAFIFDGLDESRLPLDFSVRKVRSAQKKASLNALITNLIEGNLLPSALIWITSRPAAANQIPPEHVSLFTEVRGFTDKHKEEYFNKRIEDETVASKIISQVKKSRSLYIMCHIPIFCWITATVLQEMVVQNDGEEIPVTLTEMYIHFLLIQMRIKNQKYDEKKERDMKKLLEMNREMILKLAKLAFNQLIKGNIMFYEDDLRECGIDMTVDSEYTGMCAEIFKKESVLHEKQVYCFIHLSIQEFLAALHVFNSYLNKNMNELQFFFKDDVPVDVQLDVLLKNAVNKVKSSENGHLDLFLRFLLGISLETNQKLLQGVLPHTELPKKSISSYIRQMQNNSSDLSPETSINHFFCLMELKDDSLNNQIKKYLCTDKFPDRKLSSSNCSALAYLLLMSGDVLEELDPKKFNPSTSACRRLIPAVRCCRKALLAGCELTETCWEVVAAALEAENSVLRELDLSDNYRVEKGATLLSAKLRSSHCNLEKLRLARCHFSQSSCANLSSALASVSSSLTELDLSNNDLQDTGVELLFSGKESLYCNLHFLRLSWCNLTEKSCSFLSSILISLRELDLSNNDLQDSGVKFISEGLNNDQCKLQILRLSGCLVTKEGFTSLAVSLSSNSSSDLRELDLSYNHPGDGGEMLVSGLLENKNCKLETLKMEPKHQQYIKAGIKKYACELTFNTNTVNTHLCLSESNRKVSYTAQNQQYPDHPERFQVYRQLLCNESLSQRCYWEVWFEDSKPMIGITYPDIERKEGPTVWHDRMRLGANNDSWVLWCATSKYYIAKHGLHDESIRMPQSNRIAFQRQPENKNLEGLQKFLASHKANMKNKFECIFEGKKDTKTKILLKKVYTQLYITEGELKEVNKEHEILKIDKAFNVKKSQEKPINCNEIFSVSEENEKIKVVLTKGIAGIGKTVSVQKFILDWAEGKANQAIDCIFLLPFREINLIKDEEFSLHELLQEFYPELEKLSGTDLYEELKLAFIFDGLDESRLPLDFNVRKVRSEQKKASLNALITNLIEGNLLPSALIWITSRPAAANQIPPEHVSLFTEVRGFTDKHKEEYFNKRIEDENVASKIISQVKKSRSLYIMCHIPIFCWITATVLQEMVVQNDGEEIPVTLTEMYIHFLLIQMRIKNQKYDEKEEQDMKKLLEMNREMILKLAKLAFNQLIKGNIMFYEDDLRECGIEVTVDSEYTGMCAEIFKTESVLHEKQVYCFIHLSIQEFLAALHVFNSYLNKNMNELQFFFSHVPPVDTKLDVLLKKAVDKVKGSENGHLDLFLRFLLGISLEKNQQLLQGLLPHTELNKRNINNVIQYIKQMQNKALDLSPETSINHFFCLMELKDDSLNNQIKKYLSTDKFPDRELSSSNCSALAYLLLMSGDILEELNPKKFNENNSAYRRLIPAVRCCKKALLAGCELTEMCLEVVASALEVENSVLTELDLSDNYRVENGAKLLSDGLRSSHCKLKKLGLARCHFSQTSCAELASALTSVSSSLRELDLSNNDLKDTGLELLFAGQETLYCNLQILRLSWCHLTDSSCLSISSILISLRELDLSNNELQDSGVKFISEGLSNKQCKLQILRLSGCLVTQGGVSLLASALSSNSSSVLGELDLSYNNPGDEGEKLLSDLLKNPNCKLEALEIEPKSQRFIKAGIRKYACNLSFNPNSANTDLCLSESNRKVSYTAQGMQYPDHPERFQLFSQVLCNESLSQRCYWEVCLEDSSPEIGITLSWCNLTEKSCLFLSSILISLRELDVSNNDLQNSGVKLISEGLSNDKCKLQILSLSGCLVTQDGFSSLASALSSNSSSVLADLDLSYNNPGDEAEKLLSDLLNNPNYKLKALKMEPKSQQFIKSGIKK